MKSEFSLELRGIGSFAFRDRHFASAVLYVLTPSEFKQNFFPPMNASKAAFSVHLATGLIAGKIIVLNFLVVVDVRVAVVVVGFNLVAEDITRLRLSVKRPMGPGSLKNVYKTDIFQLTAAISLIIKF